MSTAVPHNDAYAKGKAFTEATNPGMEDALAARYDGLYPRGVLDDKTRELLTISALTALGAQTAPQLKIHVAAARKLGVTREEISEAIYQMSLYGGMPAMFNALNAAMSVFDVEDTQ
jgi:4-carboxymuconolactone decarboxylase